MKEDLTGTQLNATFDELFKQSDRAAAVVSGSILEEILQRMLLAFFLSHNNIEKNLFDGLTPLSTFGAKIDIAYHVGLINDAEYGDLKLIKRIRNEFAHSIKGINFDAEIIKNRCYELQTLKLAKPPQEMMNNIKNVKTFFQINVSLLSTILFAKISEIKHCALYEYKIVK